MQNCVFNLESEKRASEKEWKKKQRIRYKYESMHDMYVVQLARVL